MDFLPRHFPTKPEADVTEDSEDPEATDMASLPAFRAMGGEMGGGEGGCPWDFRSAGPIEVFVDQVGEITPIYSNLKGGEITTG